MTNEEPLYDLTTFREMDEEDPGALVKIVSVFIDTTPAVLSELNNAYASGELTRLAQLAHKLKATIDILAISSLTGIIRQIEQVALAGDPKGELQAMVKTLNITLDKVFIKIREEIS